MERKVLILTDGKAGHENQSKAFARALGCEYDLVEVHFKSKFAKALSYLFDRFGLLSLSLLQSNNRTIEQSNNSYSAVIGTGSGTFYAAKALARRLGVKCGVVLYPRGYRISTFDCVLAPAFDNPAKAPNVIEIPANLVANDEAFYAKGVAAFWERRGGGQQADDNKAAEHARRGEGQQADDSKAAEHARVGDGNKRAAVAVIVGGPNKCSTMTPEWMKGELTRIFTENGHPAFQSNNRTIEQSNNSSVEFWVTTSRRTPPEVEAVVDSYPWDYRLLYSKDHFNPIPAFVKLAKRLYVTAESTGMLSESCTFGTADVVALDNLKPGPHKFRRFGENLRAAGYVDGTRKVDLSAQFAAARKLLGFSTSGR